MHLLHDLAQLVANDTPLKARMFVDGRWGEAAMVGHEVENPANAQTIAVTPAGDAGTAEDALLAARQAQRLWARRPAVERGQAV